MVAHRLRVPLRRFQRFGAEDEDPAEGAGGIVERSGREQHALLRHPANIGHMGRLDTLALRLGQRGPRRTGPQKDHIVALGLAGRGRYPRTPKEHEKRGKAGASGHEYQYA